MLSKHIELLRKNKDSFIVNIKITIYCIVYTYKNVCTNRLLINDFNGTIFYIRLSKKILSYDYTDL